MFIIYDGRESFYQWDLDRKLIVKDNTIKEVHFCNKTDDCSLVCETYTEGGLNIVNVPNILLQDNWRINVYAYDSNYTKFSAVFDVVKRSKPADYIYTETEVKRYEDLESSISTHEEAIINLKKKDDILQDMINNIEVSGGITTDKTLSIEGASADAKAVGDKFKRTYNTLEITKATELPDLDKAPLNTVININGCLQSIANIPNTDKVNATLFCFNGKPERQDTGYWTHTTQILSCYTYPYNENSNITYIRSCWGNYWMPWDLLLTDNNTVIPNYANFSAFKRFGTIGDSLSTGTYSNEAGETVEHLEKSWGTHIANKCNNQCLTLGFGGATTTRWIDGVSWHENNMTKALLPENECDAYIICMGYNDNNVNTTSGGVELGSMADIDADNVDNNAVSYYGNMDKICRKLHSTFPKAKIFVLNNPFYNTNKAESYNIALKEVCDRLAGNSVYLIDMYSRYNKIYRKFAGDREGNHFHPQVYQYMGMLIATAISDYMKDNYTEFKYIENEHIVIENDTPVVSCDSSGWKKLIDYTTTEDIFSGTEIPSITFTEDMEGNPLQATNLFVKISGTMTNGTVIRMMPNNTYNAGFAEIQVGNSAGQYGIFSCFLLATGQHWRIWGVNGKTFYAHQGRGYQQCPKYIGDIAFGGTNYTLQTGARFEVWEVCE